ncbi:hypothetical protein M5K25_003192 [Dendrobium thyrsiflorum]|uniref:Uncharacterized protein n=1 Tax=Dendrobium thyrsiflorum TaxID=117978 RepID=A0ABD0VVT7_DENTH
MLLVKIRKLTINYLSDFFLTTRLWDLHNKKVKTFIMKNVATADGSFKPMTNNGSFQNGNGDFMDAKQKAEFCHHDGKSRVNTKHSLDSGTTKPDKRADLSSRKGRRNASFQLLISNDHYRVGNKKKARDNSDSDPLTKQSVQTHSELLVVLLSSPHVIPVKILYDLPSSFYISGLMDRDKLASVKERSKLDNFPTNLTAFSSSSYQYEKTKDISLEFKAEQAAGRNQ